MKQFIPPQQSNKRYWIFAILLTTFYLSFLSSNAQSLSIEVTRNKADVLTCENIAYTLKYSCAAGTGNCTNVTMTASAPSGVIFPQQNVGLTSDILSYTFSADRRSVNFVFKEPLVAGNTGIIQFNGKRNLSLANGITASLMAIIASGFSPPTIDTVITIPYTLPMPFVSVKETSGNAVSDKSKEKGHYVLSLNNTGNAPIRGVVVEDIISCRHQYLSNKLVSFLSIFWCAVMTSNQEANIKITYYNYNQRGDVPQTI